MLRKIRKELTKRTNQRRRSAYKSPINDKVLCFTEHVTLENGTILSIQAADYLYCHPKNFVGNLNCYRNLEVCVVDGEIPERLKPYHDGHIMPYVKHGDLIKAIRDCGGIKNNSKHKSK